MYVNIKDTRPEIEAWTEPKHGRTTKSVKLRDSSSKGVSEIIRIPIF